MASSFSKRKRCLKTLIWKNRLLKQRHYVATTMEIILPLLFIILFGSLKTEEPDVLIPAGWSTGDTSASLFTTDSPLENIPGVDSSLLIPRYAATETSLTGILMYMNLQSFLQHPTLLQNASSSSNIQCILGGLVQGNIGVDSLPASCPTDLKQYKIAIAPDTPDSRNRFFAKISQWYPSISLASGLIPLAVPSFEDSVVFYDTESQLEAYIKGPNYGIGRENPLIYAAIVFEESDSDDLSYAIRMNATQSNRFQIASVPKTSTRRTAAVDSRNKKIITLNYITYATFGFNTLSSLVTKFVTCDPDNVTLNCNNPDSVIAASDIDDDTMYSNLFTKDVLVSGLFEALDGATSALLPNIGNTSSLLSNPLLLNQLSFSPDDVPSESKELLLKPLRQIPNVNLLDASVYNFPIESFVSSPFFDAVGNVFGLGFLISYLYFLSRVLQALITEKETKTREILKIMGVRSSVIICSWYATYMIIGLLASFIQALLAATSLFTNSTFFILFIFFFCFSTSVVSFSFMISVFFDKSKTGSFAGMTLFFAMFFMSNIYSVGTSEGLKVLGSFLSPLVLYFTIQIYATVESSGIGLTFSNIATSYDNYRVITGILMLILDSVLYTVIGLYFNQVLAKEYGTRKPYNFFLKKKKKTSDTAMPLLSSSARNDDDDHIEPVTSSELLNQERNGETVSISKLRKDFATPGGKKTAVNNLDLVMYSSQICCLLGHNGAGKSTLINMLTGMLEPSAGDAVIRNKSLVNDIDEIRNSLSICPQHDVLYAELTVEEHLEFYARLKGVSDVRHSVASSITSVGLTEKAKTRSSNLSGGMKRKLSVAIALTGNSDVVFLDEPTSGMDPYSRRSTWELLQNNRSGRVMILTTHFMDEADLLGDRIAIMAAGKVKCVGSSLFLKQRYGAGYVLTLVLDSNTSERRSQVVSTITSLITTHVPSAVVTSNVGTEVSFQLSSEFTPAFPNLFTELDDKMQELCVLQYGISVTTLEQVFLNVAKSDESDDVSVAVQVEQESSSSSSNANRNNNYSPTFISHFIALFKKRFRYSKRDKRSFVYSVIVPLVLLTFGFALLKVSTLTETQPRLELSLNDSDFVPKGTASPVPYYCIENNNNDNGCQELMKDSFINAVDLSGVKSYDGNASLYGISYENLDPLNNGSLLAAGEAALVNAPSDGIQYGGYVLSTRNNSFAYAVMVNSSATHASPIYKSMLDEALVTKYVNKTLTVSQHPLPRTAATTALFNSFLSFSAVLFIVIAFAFYPAAVVVFIVKEVETSSKHQQLVSGVSLVAFWLSHFCYDLLVYLVPMALALILIQGFEITSFTGATSACVLNCTTGVFTSVVILFMFFGLAIVPFTYVLSRVFKAHASAQNLTLMLNFAIGITLMVVSFTLDIVSEDTQDVNATLKFLWRLSPLFNLGNGLLNISTRDILNNFGLTSSSISAFDLDVVGYELLYLGLECLVFITITVVIDLKLLTKPTKKKNVTKRKEVTDSDVLAEKERIKTEKDDVIRLENLTKVYADGKVAVSDLSFGLPRGTCFGFLGINGAGKTSTMKMITGDTLPTSGTAYLNQKDIVTSQLEIRREIGYCPQFDALFDLLTVEEHLDFYSDIKGIIRNEKSKIINDTIATIGLSNFRKTLAGALSGGNKRKLSVAIAMLGSPPVIFLDEPSTGMDPVSRRAMWKVISNLQQSNGTTIVLTTHSMEECEALCNTVGIMVGGQLQCLGSIQHLKSKFGKGFLSIDIRLNVPTPEESSSSSVMTLEELQNLVKDESVLSSDHPTGWYLLSQVNDGTLTSSMFNSWKQSEKQYEDLMKFMTNTFDSVTLVERHEGQCRFKVRRTSTLSVVFKEIESQKTLLGIKDYAVSQTTLEQIFNQFAAAQEEEGGAARGVLK